MDADSATILHISDLHFGASYHLAAWENFIEYVGTLKPLPKVALVTGDIVDTPTRANFDLAIAGMKRLSAALGADGVRYSDNVVVCPGNHDRFVRGNRIPFTKPHLLYDNKIESTAGSVPRTFPLEGGEGNRWKLTVASIDTSQHAGISAQGFVVDDDLKLIRELADQGFDETTPFSLVVLMMHHHVLPIASLEPTEPTVRRMFSATQGTNPGRVLKSLSEGRVDLVLHGHEHQEHSAKYGLYIDDTGEVAVVGAGSATGMDTLMGCSIARSSFNVIELRSDRSVWLNVIRGPDAERNRPKWGVVAAEKVQLLDSLSVRRNRFVRALRHWAREKRVAPVAKGMRLQRDSYSEWERHVTLTAHRDAIVWDRKTNWSIENERIEFAIINDTGMPALPKAKVYPKDRPREPIQLEAEFRPGAEAGTYTFMAQCPKAVAIEAHAIETSFEWRDAILLTQEDLALVVQPGEVRVDGLEFVSATVRAPLANLMLTVNFPAGYLPPASEMRVLFKDVHADRPFERDAALTARLQVAGQTAILNIPYPLLDYRYAIAWRPMPEPGAEDKNKTDLVERLLTNESACRELLGAAALAFDRDDWKTLVSVALFVPDLKTTTGQARLLRRGEAIRLGGEAAASGSPLPLEVDLSITNNPYAQALYRTAWWGEVGFYGRDGAGDNIAGNAGVILGERMALTMPIWPGGRNGHPAAIFRVGVQDSPSAPNEESLLASIEKLQVRVLHQLII